MQGRSWAGLQCTGTMDKLGKIVYNDPELLYKYMDCVDVPPLEMVDDILTVSKYGTTSVTLNATVNEFISTKKLKLSNSKCSNIHVGYNSDSCPQVYVHVDVMKTSDREKYLGDIVDKNCNSHATIVERAMKGLGILTNIRALIMDIPLGKHRTEIGLTLRQAWFINGVLFNSETWNQLSKKDMEK